MFSRASYTLLIMITELNMQWWKTSSQIPYSIFTKISGNSEVQGFGQLQRQNFVVDYLSDAVITVRFTVVQVVQNLQWLKA